MENVPTGKLIDEIVAKTGLPRKDVQSVVDALGETITDVLARGGRVELRNLVAFSVDERAPRLCRNPSTGQTMVVPTTRVVKVRVSQSVRRRVADEALSTGSGVYIATPDDPWTQDLRDGLREIGYDITVGRTFAEAMAGVAVKPQALSFVMVGPSIDEDRYGDVARDLKLDAATAMLPVVRGTLDVSSLEQPRGVYVVPDAVFDSAEGAADLVRDEAERWREEKLFFGRQVTLRAQSDAPSIEALKKLLEAFYKGAIADETEEYKTLSAFREAIDNAAVHGNESSPDRYLTATLMQDDERIALDVKDQGPGFDAEMLLGAVNGTDTLSAARERLGRGASGGLGIRVMNECADEVRYAENGTRVTLVKRRVTQ